MEARRLRFSGSAALIGIGLVGLVWIAGVAGSGCRPGPAARPTAAEATRPAAAEAANPATPQPAEPGPPRNGSTRHTYAGAPDRSPAENGLRFRNPARAAFRHHEIDVRIDPEGARLQATDRALLCHPPQIPTAEPVPFLLNRNLEIQGIETTHRGTPFVSLAWREHERWQPRSFWAQPQYPELGGLEHARQIDLFFEPTSDLAFWPESLLVTITYQGAVYDSLKPPPESYQRGFETTSGLIDPRGAFLSGGTLWYPQRFDEPFGFELTVSVPQGWQAVSQGAREVHGPTTVTWHSPEPMDEIYLVAGPYELREETHRGVAIQTFTYGNDDEEICRTYLDATRDYLDLYTERIGPYPFAKFALVENFWQTGYGMPSFTLLGDRVIRLPFIVRTSYGHEILHNWWGNGVFVDWESGNWCEGLTVYGADYLYKEREGAAAACGYRRNQLQDYLNYVRAGRDFPLTEFRQRHDASSAAVGYGKAMMLCHMLREQMGSERFWAALAEFYQRFLFSRADWFDLLGVFAEYTDLDVDHFHQQWLARAGAPMISLGASDLIARNDGEFDLSYRVDQEEPYYELTVPLRLTYADAPAEEWTLALTGARTPGSRRLSEKPLALEVDPDFDLFRRLHRAEVPAALSQLLGADSVAIVLAAQTPAPLHEAYHALAEQSQAAKPTGELADTGLALLDLAGSSAWLLGEPEWSAALAPILPAGVNIEESAFHVNGERFDRATHALVLALPHPHNPDGAIGLLLGNEADAVAGIWRKLPHYGKYSYLVFAGTANIARGVWSVERSPLKVVWKEGSQP